MSGTAYTEQIVLDSLLLAADFPTINDLTLALFIAGTEVSATEYSRVPISFSAAYANDTRIEFSMAVSTWGSPTQAVLIGAGNNQLAIGTISPGVIGAGYRVVAEIGSIVVNLT
jgi:hypothetical protein